MSDTEIVNSLQESLDNLVKEIKEKLASGQSPLSIMVDHLKRTSENNYYQWASLGEDDLSVWQVRFPRSDLPEEQWLKEEDVHILHICDAERFLKSIENQDTSTSEQFAAYVRDSNNGYSNEEEFCCQNEKCKAKMPLDLAKKGKTHISLHKLNKKL